MDWWEAEEVGLVDLMLPVYVIVSPSLLGARNRRDIRLLLRPHLADRLSPLVGMEAFLVFRGNHSSSGLSKADLRGFGVRLLKYSRSRSQSAILVTW